MATQQHWSFHDWSTNNHHRKLISKTRQLGIRNNDISFHPAISHLKAQGWGQWSPNHPCVVKSFLLSLLNLKPLWEDNQRGILLNQHFYSETRWVCDIEEIEDIFRVLKLINGPGPNSHLTLFCCTLVTKNCSRAQSAKKYVSSNIIQGTVPLSWWIWAKTWSRGESTKNTLFLGSNLTGPWVRLPNVKA